MNAVPLSIPVQLEGEIDVYKGCVQPNKKIGVIPGKKHRSNDLQALKPNVLAELDIWHNIAYFHLDRRSTSITVTQ